MKFFGFFLSIFFVFSAQAQQLSRDIDFRINGSIVVKNFHGKVSVSAEEAQESKVSLTLDSPQQLADGELEVSGKDGRLQISVAPQNPKSRVDVTLKIPLRSRVRVETRDGEVRIAGNVESAEVTTETGTISTDVPLDSVKYNFLWTAARPRYLSDVALDSEVKEKSGGRFVLSGKLGEAAEKKEKEKGKKEEKKKEEESPEAETPGDEAAADPKSGDDENKEKKTRAEKALENRNVALDFTTDRGIVLLNVNPAEVPSNLQERPLTEAAKAIVRSGDSLLAEAIRRSSPKYFGDYLKSLPPRRREPSLTEREKSGADRVRSQIKQAVVKVTDLNNRAIGGLQKTDFTVLEYGKEREILTVEPTTAPFNLVLLLDVSGSIDNYVDFIRKAARSFIHTMRPDDKIAIIIFNEDVKQISTFTTDRSALSESLDTFDAGGGTAFYDSLAYTLVETLKPLRGERTAVVVLSDGDDNRSFLPFDSLLGSIQESGALIYPLYVPSALIAASKTADANDTADPLRARYMALSSKSEAEGARLAQVSGGVYYPIRRLDELQKAYDDIVVQLRTAYTITYRSDLTEPVVDNRASPRLRIRVSRENSFVIVNSVIDFPKAEAVRNEPRETSKNLVYPDGKAKTSFKYRNASFVVEKKTPETDPSLRQVAEITGEITNVKYKPLLTNDLQVIAGTGFDINKSPPAFILEDGAARIAVSRWVSPKRTRSYPYERIYNTLLHPKKATVIPVLKDEGAKGERDFLQFDTFSLLNLLDVYVILGYYGDAARDSAETLTDQKFDAEFINAKIRELRAFKGTATEWNLKELKNISALLEKAKAAYAEISSRTGVAMHDGRGLDNFVKRINQSLEEFRLFSRQKSQSAQAREFQTIQPLEALATDTKARVTISDPSGGKYFFTCDETKFENRTIYLIEAKHSSRAKMPSASDIKDGLLKMMLYSNLKNVRLGGEAVASRAAVRLTSSRLEGSISSESDAAAIETFLQINRFTAGQKGFVKKLFEEARENNFAVIIEQAEAGK